MSHFEWPRGKQQFSLLFFFFNPKTALSEAPKAGMIFSQYTFLNEDILPNHILWEESTEVIL